MDDRILKEAIDKFLARTKDIAVLYGGDGTLVGEWRKFRTRKGGKCLLPVRNYGLCQKHLEFYIKFFTTKDEDPGEDISIKQFLFPVLRGEFKDKGLDNYLDVLSELTVVNADQTTALRFNIKVNSKPIVENVIANGVILATKLEISRYFNSPNDGDWHNIGEQLNFEICWSEEKQLYFVAEYYRAKSGKVDTSRKNWGRTHARKSFMNEVAQLEDSLTKDGVQIGELKETSTTIGWKHGLERKFIACIGPEVIA